MRWFAPLFGGIVALALGVGLWAVVAYFMGCEVGWMAWAVGALAGFGAWFGAGMTEARLEGMPRIVLAVGLAMVGMLGGKFVGAWVHVDRAFELKMVQLQEQSYNEEYFIALVAKAVMAQAATRGIDIDYRNGKTEADAAEQADFDPVVWRVARERWGQMTSDERTAIKQRQHQAQVAYFADLRSTDVQRLLSKSFGFIDIVFIFLGIVSAYRIVCVDREQEGGAVPVPA